MNAETVPPITLPLQAGSASPPSSGSRNVPRASTSEARSSMTGSPGCWDDGLARHMGELDGVAEHERTWAPGHIGGESTQLRGHPVADERQLVALVVRVGEAELEKILVDELPRGPGEDLDAFLAPAGIRQNDVAGTDPRRRPERDGGERSWLNPEPCPSPPSFVVEETIRAVEPEKIFALDVEHQHAEVGGALAHQRRVLAGRQHPQEEQCERGLRGDAADAADRHVTALASVEEVQIYVDRLVVAAEAHAERARHLVDVESFAALLPARALNDLAGIRRDPDLGIHPRHGHLGAANLGGRKDAEFGHTVGVRLEGRPLVHRLGLGHHAVGPDLPGLGHLRAHDDQVVELEVVLLIQHHSEGAGGRVLRSQDAADAVFAFVHAASATAARSAR